MQNSKSRLFNRQWSSRERPAEAAKEAVLAGGLNRKTINGFFAVPVCAHTESFESKLLSKDWPPERIAGNLRSPMWSPTEKTIDRKD